ncbi:MAG: hypothetical protein [Caudoviricetes sp.]|nr:MAG: hypothetical protein [Caudoviricetes sp.]
METKSNACERCIRCIEGRFDLCKNHVRLVTASRDALPFVAFAYAQGIDGAEAAGRAMENALEASEDGWSGWATQYPGKMPKLWGAKHIAEANFYPEEGQRMFLMCEVIS